VLKAVETAGIRNLKDEELAAWIRRYEQRHLPLHGNNVAGRFPLLEERRRDEASHYILRLAFCGAVPNETSSSSISSGTLITPEDGRRWFVQQEVQLFKIRLQMLGRENRMEREQFLNHALQLILDMANIEVRLLSAEEKATMMDDLRCIHSAEVLDGDFFKVSWELVPDLVGKRMVVLRRGFAHVPRAEAISIVLSKFKDDLEASLERIAREVPFLRDDRIIPLLDALRHCDFSLDAAMSGSGDGVSSSLASALAASDVDRISVHFPPCMQLLHRSLRADHHLKFQGRQQFGLFLKSIGMPLGEALAFWRAAFAAKFTSEQFAKEYAYNVRHNYGQEGKRANYSSYSCAKTCGGLTAPGAGEYHGCPFKHTKGDRLAAILTAYTGPNGAKLQAQQVKEIVSLSEATHYQLACTRVFELTRPTKGPVETIVYPHKFFESSLQSIKK